VHKTLEARNLKHISCRTTSPNMAQAVTATYLGHRIGGSHVSVATPPPAERGESPSLADRLVAAITAIVHEANGG